MFLLLLFVAFLMNFEPINSFANIIYAKLVVYACLFICFWCVFLYKKPVPEPVAEGAKVAKKESLSIAYYSHDEVVDNIPAIGKFSSNVKTTQDKLQRLMMSADQEKSQRNRIEIQSSLESTFKQIEDSNKLIQTSFSSAIRKVAKERGVDLVFKKDEIAYMNVNNVPNLSDEITELVRESLDEGDLKFEPLDFDALAALLN